VMKRRRLVMGWSPGFVMVALSASARKL